MQRLWLVGLGRPSQKDGVGSGGDQVVPGPAASSDLWVGHACLAEPQSRDSCGPVRAEEPSVEWWGPLGFGT